MASITPFLMFKGDANAAIELYSQAFEGLEVLSISRYGKDGPGEEGTVKQAVLSIFGNTLKVIDSAVDHEFEFTPSVSFFVDCDSAAMQTRLFETLSNNGEVLMPIDNYGFSVQFAWVKDPFGVSWQLNLDSESEQSIS